MQRISTQKPQHPKTLLCKLFINPCKNSRPLELILLILQCTTFLYLISSFTKTDDHHDIIMKHIGIRIDCFAWIVVLVVGLVGRFLFGVGVVRGMYLVCIGWLLDVPISEINIIRYITIWVLLILLLVIDILSHIQLLFNTTNPYSQTLNITKFLHYIILSLTLVLYFKITSIPSYVITIINIILITLLLGLKIRSKSNNSFFKTIICRFYVLCFGYFVRNLVRYWVNLFGKENIGYQHVIVIASTQLLYTIIQQKNSKIQIDIEISNGSIVNVIYIVLGYLYSNSHDQQMQQVIQQLLLQTTATKKNALNLANKMFHDGYDARNSGKGQINSKGIDVRDDNRCMEDEVQLAVESAIVKGSHMYANSQIHSSRVHGGQGINSRMTYSNNRVDDTTALLAKHQKLNSRNFGLLGTLNKTDIRTLRIAQKSIPLLQSAITQQTDHPLQCLLLIAQIKFIIYSNLIISHTIIQKIKSQIFILSIIDRICIYKLEYNIQRNVQTNYVMDSQPQFLQFFSNQLIRNNIVRNTYDHLELWKYVHANDIQFSKLSMILEKVLKNSKMIDRMYQTTSYKCQTIVDLYAEYLFMVRRDVQSAKKINRMCLIFEEAVYNLNVDNKIYICLGMEENNRMIIENVSFNIKKLLGYDRCNVKYNHASLFMPAFFVQQHQKMVNRALENNQFNLYVFDKKIILKNNDQYYEPGRLEVKLVYNMDGQLKMEGYIQILTNNYIVKQSPNNSSYNYYNWSNYFFLSKQDEQIVEVSPSLREVIDLKPRKFAHCRDYFENSPSSDNESDLSHPSNRSNIGTQTNIKITKNNVQGSIRTCKNIPAQRKYLFSNGIQYEYIMYRTLQINNEKEYLFYVCKNTEEEREVELVNLAAKKRQPKLSILYKIQGFIDICFKFHKYALKYEDFETNLEQFFTNKKTIVQMMNRKKVPLMFGIAIFLLLAVFALQGALLGRVEVVKASNTVIKNDMTRLIQFYHELNNIGMVVEGFAFNIKKNTVFNYNYYKLAQLCISMQTLNEYLYKFDKKMYSLPADYVTQSVQYPKSFKQIISQMLAGVLTVIYIRDIYEMQLVMVSFNHFCDSFQLIWGKGLGDYLDVYLQSVDQTVNEDNRIKLGLSIGAIVILLAVYILVVKIDDSKREYEYQSINLISSINSSMIFCNSTNEFLRRSVGGINQKDFNDNKNTQKSAKNTTMNGSKPELSGNISSRQNSVRGLFQQSMVNSTHRSGFHAMAQNSTLPYNTLEMKEKKEEDAHIRKKEKIRPRSKKFLFMWTLAFLVVSGVIIVYLVTDTVGNQVSLTESVKNLLIILSKSTKLSSNIISYLHMIALNQPNTLFLANYNSYQQLEKQNQQVIFQEASYAEFNNFSALLQKVNYVYMCEYMKCDPKYKEDVNIMYNSAVHKFNSYMLDNANFGNKKIEGQVKTDIELLFYAHYLLESTLYNLLKTYLSDYNRYQANKYLMVYLFYEFQLVALAIFSIVCLVYYCGHFRKEKRKYLYYLEFIKRQSYEDKVEEI